MSYRHWALAVLAGLVGCGEKAPADPEIHARRVIYGPSGGASLGPVGGGYNHGGKGDVYDGPASKAPPWAAVRASGQRKASMRRYSTRSSAA